MIWINITNILYDSKFTGIIRTEYELCNYAFQLKNQGHNIGFCHYDIKSGFIIIDDNVLEKRLTDLKNGNAIEFKRLAFLPKLSRSLSKRWVSLKYMFGYVKNPFNDNDTIIGVGQSINTNEMDSFFKIKKQTKITIKILCHDLMPVSTPQFVFENVTKDFRKYINKTINVTDFFYCNSQFTKSELTEYYHKNHLTPPPMQVVTLGCDLQNKAKNTLDDNSVNNLIKEPYLIFVSTIEIRKNHQLIYDMYLKLLEQGVTNLPKIYFIGRRGWKVDELFHNLDNDERIKDKIFVLNNVNDSQLLTLYKHCWFTLYPSFIEGYGLPVAESLSMGKYCLSSNAGSLPEAGGEFIDYLSPNDVNAWCEKFLFLINNPEYIMQKEQYIKENYKPTSWQSFAKEILDNEF